MVRSIQWNGRKHYGTSSSRQRHDHACRQSSNTAIASFDRGVEPGVGINPKTVAKWRKRQTVEDQKTGPKEPRSTVLSAQEEAVVVAFRRHTLLPLDECLYALQPTIPDLTRSSVHRCLQRHGVSRLPEVDGNKPKKQRFKRYPIGFFHIDIAEVRTAEGKLFEPPRVSRRVKLSKDTDYEQKILHPDLSCQAA